MSTSGPGTVVPARHTAVLGEDRLSLLERAGTDPPVLLLHGWGASAAGFSGLLRLARTPRRLVAVDLPGFGESPMGETEWSRQRYAELIRELVRQRGWQNYALLGHSYGGGVSVCLAAEPGSGPDRLLLCAPSGIPVGTGAGTSGRVRVFRILRRSAETILPGRLSQPAVEWLRQRMGSSDYRSAGPLRPILVRAVQEDLSPLAKRISVPTLILWGAQDSELPLNPVGRRLGELISSSELVEFEGSGHFPFVDEPGHFAAVFDSFVDATL